MKSEDKNTDKDKEAHNKLEQEIHDALNGETELDSISNEEISPFNESLEEIPLVDNEYYFHELCNWLSNGYQQLLHEVYTEKDYVIRYAFYPPEQFPDSGDIQKQTWESIIETELELQFDPARQRVFYKSPQHHVFLISILEAIERDTEKFIEIYVTQTNKKLELKYAGGIRKCLELLIGELKTYLKQDDIQLIPILFHTRDYGLMMSMNGYELNNDENQPVFEFGFSKDTSDNFVKQLIKSIETRLASLNFSKGGEKTAYKDNSGARHYENKKRIEINKNIILNLFKLLTPYFDEKDHNDLEKLLNGEKISKVLLFKSNGIKLVDVFFRLKETGEIINSKVDIQRWICSNFEFLERNKVVKPFQGYYIKKIMTGQTLISKNSRISFKSLDLS